MPPNPRGHPKDGRARPHIVIAGAGSIGCFTGGLWAASGLPVTLLARDHVIADICANDLTLSDFSGLSHTLNADQLTLTTDPACLKTADLVAVCVKTSATADIAAQIGRHTPSTIPVISLQNGLEASDTLRSTLPNHDSRAAMVAFNVVPQGAGRFHRSTSGDIFVQSGAGGISDWLNVPGLRVIETSEITAYQWGKLLINLTNALNALSGLTLREMLVSRPWRCLMADQMTEGLQVLKAARIATKSTSPLPSPLIPYVLRLPTSVFMRVAAQMLTIDPMARTSMAYDLQNQRLTEIDSLQGIIIAMGATHGIATPICAKVAAAIKSALNQPPQHLHPEALR